MTKKLTAEEFHLYNIDLENLHRQQRDLIDLASTVQEIINEKKERFSINTLEGIGKAVWQVQKTISEIGLEIQKISDILKNSEVTRAETEVKSLTPVEKLKQQWQDAKKLILSRADRKDVDRCNRSYILGLRLEAAHKHLNENLEYHTICQELIKAKQHLLFVNNQIKDSESYLNPFDSQAELTFKRDGFEETINKLEALKLQIEISACGWGIDG